MASDDPVRLRHVVDHVDEVVDRRLMARSGAHDERAPGSEADDAAAADAGEDLLVVDVSRIRGDGARIRMAEDDRPAAAVDELEGRALAGVRGVEQDPDAVRFFDDALAELRKSSVGSVEAAVGELVRRVVREKELSQAEPGGGLDAVELPADEIAALRRENEGRFALPLRAADVRDALGDQKVLVLPREAVPFHEVHDDLVESVMRTAGGDGVGGDAVAVRLFEVGVGPDLHRGVDEDVGMVPLENGMKAAVLHPANDTTSDKLLRDAVCDSGPDGLAAVDRRRAPIRRGEPCGRRLDRLGGPRLLRIAFR